MAKSGDHYYTYSQCAVSRRSPSTTTTSQASCIIFRLHPLLKSGRLQALHSLSTARELPNLSHQHHRRATAARQLRARTLFHQKYGDSVHRQPPQQQLREGCQLEAYGDDNNDDYSDEGCSLKQSSVLHVVSKQFGGFGSSSSEQANQQQQSLKQQQHRRRVAAIVNTLSSGAHQLGHHHHFVSYPQR